jgi:hypothetical protein
MIARAWLGIVTSLASLTSCAALEPDVGLPLAGTCDDRDSDPAVRISYTRQIRPLIDRSVAGCGCHLPSPGGPGPGTRLGGLDLSSLASLRKGGFSGLQIVVEGEPCASLLYQKVSLAPPFGSRMPLGGPPFLTAAELQLLHDWLSEGAGDAVPAQGTIAAGSF